METPSYTYRNEVALGELWCIKIYLLVISLSSNFTASGCIMGSLVRIFLSHVLWFMKGFVHSIILLLQWNSIFIQPTVMNENEAFCIYSEAYRK